MRFCCLACTDFFQSVSPLSPPTLETPKYKPHPGPARRSKRQLRSNTEVFTRYKWVSPCKVPKTRQTQSRDNPSEASPFPRLKPSPKPEPLQHIRSLPSPPPPPVYRFSTLTLLRPSSSFRSPPPPPPLAPSFDPLPPPTRLAAPCGAIFLHPGHCGRIVVPVPAVLVGIIHQFSPPLGVACGFVVLSSFPLRNQAWEVLLHNPQGKVGHFCLPPADAALVALMGPTALSPQDALALSLRIPPWLRAEAAFPPLKGAKCAK